MHKFHLLIMSLVMLNNLTKGMSPTETVLTRTKRVVGGLANAKGSRLYGASIQYRNYFGEKIRGKSQYRVCGGILIRANWLITAAHCFRGPEGQRFVKYRHPRRWHVRLGGVKLVPNLLDRMVGYFNRLINSWREQKRLQAYYHIDHIMEHPQYVFKTGENDIALVKLVENPLVQQMNDLDILNLPEATSLKVWPYPKDICAFFGWGCTKGTASYSNEMYEAKLPVISSQECAPLLSSDTVIHKQTQFCAGYSNKNIGVCTGDNGGPLICADENGKSHLAGILSSFSKENTSHYPSVFTRVSIYLPWINSILEQQ